MRRRKTDSIPFGNRLLIGATKHFSEEEKPPPGENEWVWYNISVSDEPLGYVEGVMRDRRAIVPIDTASSP